MADYNIEPKEVKHPVTSDVVGTAVSVTIAAIVEPDGQGNAQAKGFYNLKDSNGATCQFGYNNIAISLSGWTGNMADLETQVLAALGVTVIE